MVRNRRPGTKAENERDFQERGLSARAVAVAAQSTPLDVTREQFAQAVAAAEARLAEHVSLGNDAWITYGVDPVEVEFWQADPERLHHRLNYSRTEGGWRMRTRAH